MTAIPSSGYLFDHWDGEFNSNTDNTALVMMDTNKTVTAVFEAIPHYNLLVNIGSPGSGTVALDPEQPLDSYLGGIEVTIVAVAADGYRFDHWSGDISGSENPLTITIDAPRSITAYFVEQRQFPWKWVAIGLAGFFLVIFLGYFVHTELSKS